MTETVWFASDWPDDLLEYVCERRRAALGITGSSDDHGPDFHSRVYPRKRRLFISACCRRIWRLLPTAAQTAIEVAERFADGAASDAERIDAVAVVEAAGKAYWHPESDHSPIELAGEHALLAAGGAVLPLTDTGYASSSLWYDFSKIPFLNGDRFDGGFGFTACHAVNAVLAANGDAELASSHGFQFLVPEFAAKAGLPVIGTVWHAELLAQCGLVRDLFGNPFRPVPFAPRWRSANVASIAEAIYADRAFTNLPILADALEDAGCMNPDILDHCRQPGEHARGCWAVDLVLGKE